MPKKNEDKTFPYCDFKCPLHESCSWYLEKINKAQNVHWGTDPFNYKKGTCSWYHSMGLDEIVKKVNDFLSPFNN